MRKNHKIAIIATTLALSITVLSGVIVPELDIFKGKGSNDNVVASAGKSTVTVEEFKNAGYELVWFDEFDGTAIDETKWGIHSATNAMSGTAEMLVYDTSHVRSQKDGNLKLNAMKHPWYNPESENKTERYPYIVPNSVSTQGKMSYQYGYLEIRAKVPYKEGCWPSFWLRSHKATDKLVNANYNIEVDIFEVNGSKDTFSSNLHQQGYNEKSYMTTASAINKEEEYTFKNSDNLSEEYHIYGFEWTPDRMAIYVDGVKQCEWMLNKFALASYGLQPDATGFDTTMNILFNNHLFTESSEYKPSDENIIENYEDNLPAEFFIDYVRLYQKNDGFSKLIVGR